VCPEGPAAAARCRGCCEAWRLGNRSGAACASLLQLCGVVGIKPPMGACRATGWSLSPFAGSDWTLAGRHGLRAALAGHRATILRLYLLDIPVPDYPGLACGHPGLRVGVPREFFGTGVQPGVEAAVRQAIQTLIELGAEIGEMSLPHTEYALPTYYLIAPAEASANLARYDGVKYGYSAPDSPDIWEVYRRTRQQGFGPEVKRRIMLGTYALSAGYYDAYYLKAQKVRTLIKQDFDQAFGRFDVVSENLAHCGLQNRERSAIRADVPVDASLCPNRSPHLLTVGALWLLRGTAGGTADQRPGAGRRVHTARGVCLRTSNGMAQAQTLAEGKSEHSWEGAPAMKVIIPLAGFGTRLRPHTFTKPKPLVSVAGKPVLGHILDKLVGLDIEEIVYVVGYMGDQIRDYVEANYAFPSRYIEQKDLRGQAHAIYLVKDYVSGPVLIIFVDTIFEADLASLSSEQADGVLYVKEVDDPRRFGVVITRGGFITQLVEKPNTPVSNLAVIGLYYIRDSQVLMDCIAELIEKDIKTQGEYFLADALQLMIDRGAKLVAKKVDVWEDCGKPETVLHTNRYLLEHGGAQEIADREFVLVPPVYIGRRA